MDRIANVGLYKGYKFYIRYQSLSVIDFYSGYVEIPKGHTLYQVDYYDLQDIDVHGGLTFSGYLDFSDEYLIGFDCGHGGDDISVQDEGYVAKSCMKMIEQIIILDEVEE